MALITTDDIDVVRYKAEAVVHCAFTADKLHPQGKRATDGAAFRVAVQELDRLSSDPGLQKDYENALKFNHDKWLLSSPTYQALEFVGVESELSYADVVHKMNQHVAASKGDGDEDIGRLSINTKPLTVMSNSDAGKISQICGIVPVRVHAVSDVKKFTKDNHPCFGALLADGTGVLKKRHRILMLLCYLSYHLLGTILVTWLMEQFHAEARTYACVDCPVFTTVDTPMGECKAEDPDTTYADPPAEFLAWQASVGGCQRLCLGHTCSRLFGAEASEKEAERNGQNIAGKDPYGVEGYEETRIGHDLANEMANDGTGPDDVNCHESFLFTSEATAATCIEAHKYLDSNPTRIGPLHAQDHASDDSLPPVPEGWTKAYGNANFAAGLRQRRWGDVMVGTDLNAEVYYFSPGCMCPDGHAYTTSTSRWPRAEQGVAYDESTLPPPHPDYDDQLLFHATPNSRVPNYKSQDPLSGVCESGTCYEEHDDPYDGIWPRPMSEVDGFKCFDHTTNTYNAGWGDDLHDDVDQENIADCCGIQPSKVAKYNLEQAKDLEWANKLLSSILLINIPAHIFAGAVLKSCFTCPCMIGKTGCLFRCCRCVGGWFAYVFGIGMLVVVVSVFGFAWVIHNYSVWEVFDDKCTDGFMDILEETPSEWFRNLAVSEIKWIVMTLIKKFNPFLTLTICGKSIIGTWTKERRDFITLLGSGEQVVDTANPVSGADFETMTNVAAST